MEKISTGRQIMCDKGRELLGDLYNQEQFEKVLGNYENEAPGLQYSLGNLESDLKQATNEVDKNRIRKEWLRSQIG